MRTPILVGIIFGIINLISNISIAKLAPGVYMGFMFTMGFLFFNIMFTILLVKREKGYNLLFIDGLKSSIQTGIVQSFFYFLSVVLIQNYIVPGLIPGLEGWKIYMLFFNVNTILFSLISVIFGAILSGLLSTKK